MCGNEVILGSADEAASLVLREAMWATAQGTFAVGGCLIENATGRVIKAMHNNVLKPLEGTEKTFTYDPTAHGERQLVEWYYQNQEKCALPEPKHLTVVTTLDPCVMCTGALLTAGFNVGVVALDGYAGINYDISFRFEGLPSRLRELAKQNFGYYACGQRGVDPDIYIRQYIGGSGVAFNRTVVSAESVMACGKIFDASVDSVRAKSSDAGLPPKDLSDPATLPENSQIKERFRTLCPNAFTIKLLDTRLPTAELLQVLLEAKASEAGAENAAALIDPFGNLILCLADAFHVSPIHTAFMNIIRSYSTIRYELMNAPGTRDEASRHLTHPKYGTIVFLHAPSPSDPATIMTLGAYGSTMEGAIPVTFPSNLQYFYPPLEGSVLELRTVMMKLPPFYRELVQVSAMEVAY